MPRYTLRGVDVDFPFEAYPCQLDYMSGVIEALQERKNALLESPTGTGKTLCLLCATLAWREYVRLQAKAAPEELRAQPHHASELVQSLREAYAELKAERMQTGDGLPTIIYASRTHSQLKQVMGELSVTGYTPRTAVLGSRQQSCLNASVQQLPSGAANQACRSLVSKRNCKWYNNIERFVKTNPDINSEVMDIEDLGKLGASRSVCPYYLSREMAGSAELIFMPYNYLVDHKTRGGLGICWDNAVLIFDEAHNVEGVCSDASSFDLPAWVMAGAIEEIGTAAELATAQGEGTMSNVADQYGKMNDGSSHLQTAANLRQLQLVLRKLEQEIAAVKVTEQKGFTAPGSYLFDLFARINLTGQTWGEMSLAMEEATTMLTNDAVEGGRRTGARATSYRLHTLHEVLSLAFSTQDAPRPGAPPLHKGFRVHVHLEQRQRGERPVPTLSYWCFSPGQAMAALLDMKVRSVLLTSGTLSPLGSFANELAIPFDVRLENPHVIDPSQVWIGVIPKGPQGHALNASYQTRNSSAYKDDLGNAIVNFARIVPDGLLVFFPSYGLLKAAIDAWKAPGAGGSSVWERISQYKAPVVEPREAAQFPFAVADYQAKLENPAYRGAVFFAVCRGKASEGLDFSDRAGRAVVITGIPYATLIDPKVQIKQEVLNEALRTRNKRPLGGNSGGGGGGGGDAVNEEGLSGDAWYVQQAMRAVNQAMGRVIRHRRDFGAILLCDERFRGENVRRQLSKWLRDQVGVHPSYGAAASSLTKFYKEQAEKVKEGLVDDGSARAARAPVVKSSRAGAGGSSQPSGNAGVSAFQLARRGSGTTQNGLPQQQLGTLAQSVPAAMDMVGLSELVGGAVAPTGPSLTLSQQQHQGFQRDNNASGSRLLGMLGDGSSRGSDGFGNPQFAGGRNALGGGIDDLLASGSGAASRPLLHQAQQQQQQQQQSHIGGGGGSGCLAGMKPWERAAAVVPLRPTAPEIGGGGRRGPTTVPAPAGPSANMVGPTHLIQKHKSQQQQEELSAATVKPENSRVNNTSAPPQIATSALLPPQAAPAAGSSRAPLPVREHQSGGGGGGGGRPRISSAAAPLLQNPARPPVDLKRKEPDDFITLLKTQLPREGAQKILDALRTYKSTKNAADLITVAAAVLHPKEHTALRIEFRKHVPKQMHTAFDAKIAARWTAAGVPHAALPGGSSSSSALQKRAMGAEAPRQAAVPVRKVGLQPVPGALLAHPAVPPRARISQPGPPARGGGSGSGGARAAAPSGKTGPPCAQCGKCPIESPHQSSCCRRVACYSCWLKAVALRACPGCKKQLKKNMLTKKFFM